MRATSTACSATRMPWPSDVPFCGERRSIDDRIAARSRVGDWTAMPPSLKATTPTMTPDGCRSTKAFAASRAAAMRVGSTSVAAMLPETSKARTTMPSFRGTLTLACGLARAKVARVNPTSIRAAGKRRRSLPGRSSVEPVVAAPRVTSPRVTSPPGAPLAAAAGTSEPDRAPMPAAASRWCRRRAMARSMATPSGMRISSSNAAGQMKVTPAASVGAEGPPCARSRVRGPRRSRVGWHRRRRLRMPGRS